MSFSFHSHLILLSLAIQKWMIWIICHIIFSFFGGGTRTPLLLHSFIIIMMKSDHHTESHSNSSSATELNWISSGLRLGLRWEMTCIKPDVRIPWNFITCRDEGWMNYIIFYLSRNTFRRYNVSSNNKV